MHALSIGVVYAKDYSTTEKVSESLRDLTIFKITAKLDPGFKWRWKQSFKHSFTLKSCGKLVYKLINGIAELFFVDILLTGFCPEISEWWPKVDMN